jgi:site-specific recombinase XerD
MAIRQRGAGWQADVQHAGKRYRETFATETDARQWETAAREALQKGRPLPTTDAPAGAFSTIEQLVKVVEKTRWTNKNGAEHQVKYAHRFLNFVGGKLTPAAALTQENVDAWIAHEAEERQLTGATINRHLSSISVLVKRAMAAGLIPRKLDLSWQSESEARLRWFSDEEEALILQTLGLWALDDWADFFVFLTDTGARTWTEAHSLRWRDVSAKPRMASFWDTKNGEGRSVPLTTRAWEAIQKHHTPASEGPFRHMSKDEGRRVYERLRAHLPQLKDTVWYTCRHTFASRLVQRGANLYRVQKLMGHKSIAQTERYAKLAPAQLIETVQLLEPQASPKPVALPSAA